MSCAEKLECAMAALRSKQNAALMETLMEHLGLDQFGQIHNIGHAMYHWASVKTKPCVNKALLFWIFTAIA